jgi:predicted nucleotidyltransferase
VVRQAELLRVLLDHHVRFIVVGGAAAVLQGVPINTLDVDVVYDRADDNVAALMTALSELDAVFRTDARRLRPNESHLRSSGHKLLLTRFGILDLLATIEDDTEYAALLPHAETIRVGDLSVLVLSLARLIEVKRKLTRPKDKLMLLHLEATLDERKKSERR